jgi:hypothetical protein
MKQSKRRLSVLRREADLEHGGTVTCMRWRRGAGAVVRGRRRRGGGGASEVEARCDAWDNGVSEVVAHCGGRWREQGGAMWHERR